MKRQLYIILTIITATLLSGCSNWLSIKPESEIILEDYWKSESDVQAVVSACYRRLTQEDIILRMMVWGELRSDNITSGDGFAREYYDIREILNGNITSSNYYNSWSGFYAVINYCNTVLTYAPVVTTKDKNYTEASLLRTEAEVRAIRAFAYFYLVRAFKEVPWISDASVSDTQDYDKAKSSEEELINHIIDDLEFAKQHVTADYGRTIYNKGKVTQNMVNALLADVYLWKQDYQKCVDACDDVVSNSNLKLVQGTTAFSRIFYKGNSTESIFELQFNDNDVVNNAVKVMYGSFSDPYGSLSFPVSLAYEEYSESTGANSPFNYRVSTSVLESKSDIRAKDFYRSSQGQYYIFKYAGLGRAENTDHTLSTYSYRSTTSNWIVYRLSDVLLMKAEALAQLDGEENLKSAMKLVNEVYLRSNEGADSLYYTDYNTQGNISKLVLRERQRELMFEGKRYFDLQRLARREGNTSDMNTYIDHKSTGATATLGAPVLNAMYFPILKSELKANPKLTQNDYYKESSSTSK